MHKTAEATGDLVGNKIADKITSVGKPKSSKKEKYEINVMEETQEANNQRFEVILRPNIKWNSIK